MILFSHLRQWCYSGRVFCMIAGFPCNTVSGARHRPGGPPPLRSRSYIYGLPGLAGKHRESCHRTTEFFLRILDLATAVSTVCGRVVFGKSCGSGLPFRHFGLRPSTVPQLRNASGTHIWATIACLVVSHESVHVWRVTWRAYWMFRRPVVAIVSMRCVLGGMRIKEDFGLRLYRSIQQLFVNLLQGALSLHGTLMVQALAVVKLVRSHG